MVVGTRWHGDKISDSVATMEKQLRYRIPGIDITLTQMVFGEMFTLRSCLLTSTWIFLLGINLVTLGYYIIGLSQSHLQLNSYYHATGGTF